MSSSVTFPPAVYHDTLPVGRSKLRQFLLTNIGGRNWSHMTTEDKTVPYWSFTVHGYECEWDKKADNWSEGKWSWEETLELAFREPFRVLARGEDYYFLTSSGALYRAPKPANGTHRKMLPVWVNRRDPITAFVTDVDRGRTFLFHGTREKPAVFEMAEGVRDRPYDVKLFAPGKEGPDALRRVVGYSRVLLALGMVSRK